MRVRVLIFSVPALAAFAWGQSYPPATSQSTTTTEHRTETRTQTEKGVFSRNWKGMLVDASCVPSGTAGAMTSSTNKGTSTNTTTTTTETPDATRNERSSSTTSSSTTETPAATRDERSSSSTSRSTETPDTTRTERSSTSEQSTTMTDESGKVERRSTADRTDQTTTSAPADVTMSGPGATARWQSCPATGTTSAFGVVLSDGRMVRLDATGNTMAAQRMKTENKWMQAATTGKPANVKVRGTLVGDTLQVQEIK